jgi:CheY-like chemotaxis protein
MANVIERRLVLLVDDDEVVRRSSTRILTRAGLEVVGAASGSEAVELFRVHRRALSLVLLDMSMPDGDGISLLDRLRGIDRTVPVVMVSGAILPEAERRLADGSLAGFVAKPFTSAELLAVVKEAARDPGAAG